MESMDAPEPQVGAIPPSSPLTHPQVGAQASTPRRKPGRPKGSISKKNRSVYAQVNQLAKLGRTPKEIQDELGISKNTVEATLVAASRARLFELLPEAEWAIKKQLKKGDGTLGLRLVEAAGVLTNEAPKFSFHDDARLQVIVQNLAPPGTKIIATANAVEGEVVNGPNPSPTPGAGSS
jgi:hypothetical protein